MLKRCQKRFYWRWVIHKNTHKNSAVCTVNPGECVRYAQNRAVIETSYPHFTVPVIVQFAQIAADLLTTVYFFFKGKLVQFLGAMIYSISI